MRRVISAALLVLSLLMVGGCHSGSHVCGPCGETVHPLP